MRGIRIRWRLWVGAIQLQVLVRRLGEAMRVGPPSRFTRADGETEV